jgi:hypothetical protein
VNAFASSVLTSDEFADWGHPEMRIGLKQFLIVDQQFENENFDV